jgi:hypothetical protein
MKGFEEYLKNNRHSLKVSAEPEKDLWSNIEHKLYSRKQHMYRKITAIAASLALLIALGTFFKVQMLDAKNTAAPLPLYSYSLAYGNIEMEYNQAVSYQLQLINETTLSPQNAEKLKTYVSGLHSLDQAYNEYTKIIEEEGCNDMLMELIIDNYRRKLELLEDLHHEITKINRYEDHESEKTKLEL